MDIAELAYRAYQFLLPIGWIAFAASFVIFAPMAAFRKTRPVAATALFFMSFLFALMAWLLGSAITLAAFGWVGVIIGWVLLGLGVVPIAIFACFFYLHVPSLGWALIILSAVAAIWRFVGIGLGEASTVEEPKDRHLAA